MTDPDRTLAESMGQLGRGSMNDILDVIRDIPGLYGNWIEFNALLDRLPEVRLQVWKDMKVAPSDEVVVQRLSAALCELYPGVIIVSISVRRIFAPEDLWGYGTS